jgi:hypothetical protein
MFPIGFPHWLPPYPARCRFLPNVLVLFIDLSIWNILFIIALNPCPYQD